MKLATASLFLFSALSVSATSIPAGRAARSLLSVARKLEENQEEDENAFLSSYSLKLIACIPGEAYKNSNNNDGNNNNNNDNDNEYEGSSVVFRLCPASDCDSDAAGGCKAGYGDYVVGINTFTENWLEDKRENMEQQDDNWNVEEFGECRELDIDRDDEDEDEDNQVQYYMGPACGDDGASIKMGFFSDETCTTVPDGVTFADISNGWELPYSSGLVTSSCESCAGYNDNGEYEIGEMCQRLYEDSGKCESKMEVLSSYGAQTGSCEYITSIMPLSKTSKGGAGKVFGWIVFFLVLGGIGFYAYSVWWRKRKSGAAADGLMN